MTHKPFKYSVDIRKNIFISNSTYINRTIYSFIFILVLWFMLKKKSENVRLRYCDGKDKYLHPTGVKDVENIFFFAKTACQTFNSVSRMMN